MNELRKTFEEFPLVAKILLVIFYDIYGIVVRICASIENKNTAGLVIGILQIFTANLFGIMWIIDLVFVCMKKPLLFTE